MVINAEKFYETQTQFPKLSNLQDSETSNKVGFTGLRLWLKRLGTCLASIRP
jgi:hypothetical protein